jgi:hypothetical protein
VKLPTAADCNERNQTSFNERATHHCCCCLLQYCNTSGIVSSSVAITCVYWGLLVASFFELYNAQQLDAKTTPFATPSTSSELASGSVTKVFC